MTKLDESTEDTTLARGLGLNRRQFLAATTGLAAGAAVAGGLGSALAAPAAAASKGVLVPPGKRGIILYTVRDAISRNPDTSSLPSGFREVLQYLASVGYKQIEFAGYRQHANSPGGANLETVEGARLLRSWLDEFGLEAEGNHGFIPSSWPLTDADRDRFQLTLEIANILGMGHMGTGSDPTGSTYVADWDAAADKWNGLGQLASAAGLKLYTHNHDAAYSFLLDSGPLDALGRPTRSSGIRRLEYFLTQTDPETVWLEMDIYWAHVAQHRHHTFTAPDGSTQTDIFDPLALVAANTQRYPLFHAKDGKRNPALTNGYEFVPFGTGDIDYQHFFANMGAKGYHNPMYEQDNAPGNATTAPGQSLDYAALSYANMAALRG